MSTFMPVREVCFICGEENEYTEVASTNTFGGSMDLDTRPPEMQRSTMPYWVQRCPGCGYVAGTVSDKTSVDRAFLESDAYRTCDGIAFDSGLAERFYRQYLILKADGKAERAFYALLRVSWACDDADDEENAVLVRGMAVEAADRLLQSCGAATKGFFTVIRADLMRRSGRLEELLEEYRDVKFGDKLYDDILDFERELARRGRTDCLTISDAEHFARGTFEWL